MQSAPVWRAGGLAEQQQLGAGSAGGVQHDKPTASLSLSRTCCTRQLGGLACACRVPQSGEQAARLSSSSSGQAALGASSMRRTCGARPTSARRSSALSRSQLRHALLALLLGTPSSGSCGQGLQSETPSKGWLCCLKASAAKVSVHKCSQQAAAAPGPARAAAGHAVQRLLQVGLALRQPF